MSERKLASIQKILNLEPIEGADAIEKATVLGWKCVVKKGDFKVGDLCIFIEVDSLLPRKPWSEFLFKGKETSQEFFRLRTIRLRKQISQGLILPVTALPITHDVIDAGPSPIIAAALEFASSVPSLEEGDDVTEIMGIQKWEPTLPANLAGKVKGNFPAFVKKTDETRIQVVYRVLETHKGKKFYATEKIDGSSMTVYLNGDDFGVCSRNLDLKEEEGNAFWKKARELDLENKMKSFKGMDRFAIQGELYGEGIQQNKYKMKGTHFAAFNIYDINEGKYLDQALFLMLCKLHGIPTVPVLEILDLNFTVDEIVNFSIGPSLINPSVQREGLVFRPNVEQYDDDLDGRLSFKVINPEFLLKHGE